jgi:hypothetical protein
VRATKERDKKLTRINRKGKKHGEKSKQPRQKDLPSAQQRSPPASPQFPARMAAHKHQQINLLSKQKKYFQSKVGSPME